MIWHFQVQSDGWSERLTTLRSTYRVGAWPYGVTKSGQASLDLRNLGGVKEVKAS